MILYDKATILKQKQQEIPVFPHSDQPTRRVRHGLVESAWTRRVHLETRRFQQAEPQKTNFFNIQGINTIETNLGSDTTDGFWS